MSEKQIFPDYHDVVRCMEAGSGMVHISNGAGTHFRGRSYEKMLCGRRLRVRNPRAFRLSMIPENYFRDLCSKCYSKAMR